MVGLDGGIMKITVFLGSMFGSRPVYKAAVTKLGRWIGKEGHWLVYGGSMTGLMGTLAEAVLSAGGKVTGVEPQMFVEQDLQSNEIKSCWKWEMFILLFQAAPEHWKRFRRQFLM